MKIGFLGAASFCTLLSACSAPVPQEPLRGHLNADNVPSSHVKSAPAPIPPQPHTAPPQAAPQTYSVIVNNVQVRDLLFALARDAKFNVDIHSGITGTVSLNAIDQTLPQLLTRISRQVDMRYEFDGPNLSVMPDAPFLRHYRVDYVNIARSMSGTVSTNTQIATGSVENAASGTAGGGNVSNTRIENASKHRFWESLEKNIKDLLHETDKIFPEGSSETVVEESATQNTAGVPAVQHTKHSRSKTTAAPITTSTMATQTAGNAVVRRSTFREAASVIINPEGGIITVRATQRQHEKIREFIDQVAHSSQRQVLIEATIVEVSLNNGYQQGINWTQLSRGGVVSFIGDALTKNAYNLQYTRGGNPDALITLLDTFGTVKVLSSPRISVLNNQSALLKVVENYVYFNVKADTTTTANVGTTTTYTTTPQSVSVGLVLSVIPQISDGDHVILNIRPTITSIAREVSDPNPDLKKNDINNLVPVIRTREIESIMRVGSGGIAILGGLMEDKIDYQTQRVPGVGQIPVVGEVVNNRNNQARKTELVIFLRPVVIKDARLEGDYSGMRPFLPDERFFREPADAHSLNAQPAKPGTMTWNERAGQ